MKSSVESLNTQSKEQRKLFHFQFNNILVRIKLNRIIEINTFSCSVYKDKNDISKVTRTLKELFVPVVA